jgi:ATP-dependent DNA helicase RecG
MAVVDEQHRFGVMQRGALRRKGRERGAPEAARSPAPAGDERHAHPALAGADPYGDLDLSVIDEMPPGRTPIETRWLTPIRAPGLRARAREEIEAGRQAFVICPLVEGSQAVESRAATEEYERLRTEEFPDLGATASLLLHGRMPAKAKDGVMRSFAAGEAASWSPPPWWRSASTCRTRR